MLLFIALAVAQPLAKVPYSLLSIDNIRGLPDNWSSLKHPSMMGELKQIYMRREDIQFIGEHIH